MLYLAVILAGCLHRFLASQPALGSSYMMRCCPPSLFHIHHAASNTRHLCCAVALPLSSAGAALAIALPLTVDAVVLYLAVILVW